MINKGEKIASLLPMVAESLHCFVCWRASIHQKAKMQRTSCQNIKLSVLDQDPSFNLESTVIDGTRWRSSGYESRAQI